MRILGSLRPPPLLIAVLGVGLSAFAQEAQITSVAVQGGQLTLNWRGPVGWTHFIESSVALPVIQWQAILTVPSAFATEQRTLPLAPGSAAGFLRVRCLPSGAGSAPRLFFTDLESGPKRGGEGDLGCFITLWGEGFGASRGDSKVTIGGQEVARYVEWGQDNAWARKLDMIVVQPGSNVVSGDLEVVLNGQRSNPLPFVVRPGRIYCVSPSGADSNSGDFGSPFRTVAQARDALAPGDIAYLMDGLVLATEETWSAVLAINSGGAPGLPKALIAYPGARVTIGATNLQYAIRVTDTVAGVPSDWVLSKLVLRAQEVALEVAQRGADRWRVVGNDLSCPYGDGQSGAFTAAFAQRLAFLGNHVHDVGTLGPQPSKQYHAVYFTTDTSHLEVGWNHIHDNMTCRAIQFHSSPLCQPDCGPTDTTGFNQFDLHVHDNLIHGDVCDGIVLATVDPSKGAILVYNNVIYDVGRGPSPPDGDANYTGIHVAGGTNSGEDGTGNVEVFNNTLYDCGARKLLPDAVGDEGLFSRGPGSTNLFLRLRNNLAYAVGGEDYLAPSSDTALITGSNNLWFGAGEPPAFLTNNLNADPRFRNLGARDFSLLADSPAINAGVETGLVRDYLGITRPQGGTNDVGAFEYFPGP